MMRPLMNLRPVVSQVGRCMGSRRNYCSASTSDKEVKVGLFGWVFVRGLPFFLGYSVAGPLVFYDKVADLEEQRQKKLREIYGESAEIHDLRDEMWSGLGESVWSLGENLWSYLSDNAARKWGNRKP